MRTVCRIPLECFQTAISPAVCQSLQQQGYAVIDNVFGSAWSTKLKQEIVHLKQQGKMHLNSTHLVKQGGTELLEKQHVYEAELRDAVGTTCRSSIARQHSAKTSASTAFLPILVHHFPFQLG